MLFSGMTRLAVSMDWNRLAGTGPTPRTGGMQTHAS
jgi:hypothetical protein